MSAYGSGPGGWGQPGHGPAPYPYPRPVEHPQGSTVLVLGILSLVVGVTAPFAWYYGVRAEREMRLSGAVYSNAAHIQVGKILGIIGTVLLAVSVLLVVGYLVFMIAIFGTLLAQVR